MLRSITLSCLVAVAVCGGCSNDPEAARSWKLRASTFNAALAPGFEPRSAQRLPAVLSALGAAARDLDVLCVQEFWVDSDFGQLLSVTAESLHESVHPAPVPGTGACTASELDSIGGCVQTRCASAASDDQVGCIQSECPSEVSALSGGCLGCLINHLDDFARCMPGPDAVVSDPAIFNGDYDSGLLSRYPISNSDVLPLAAYFQRGAVLYARLEVPHLGPVHAFCTHLSSPLGIISYAGAFGSWDGEHRRETEQLLEFIQTKAGASEPVLVMGDLNMGLAVENGEAVLAEDFQRILATGLTDPYLDGGEAHCSECNDNTFRAADSTNDLVDHLLIDHFPNATARVTREFTTPAALDPQDGDATPSHLSDHYGLRLELESR